MLPDWGLWLIGHEPNVPDPSHYEKASLRVLIVRLSSYHDVSSSMTHGLLGQITSGVQGVYADYGFMPPPLDVTRMLHAGVPPLFGTTSKRPFSDFDIIAFSNSVTQELFSIPWLLLHSGISFDYRARIADEGIPLLIMGGANAQSAFIACPSGGDSSLCLVDALFFGEAEADWPALLEYLAGGKEEHRGKGELLAEAVRRFPSFYAPFAGKAGPRRRSFLPDLGEVRSLVMNPVWYDEETAGSSSVAVDAGCPFLCAFCKEAWEGRPYRKRPLDRILADIEDAKRHQGLDTINLFSFSLTNHPDARHIIREAQARVAHVSMKSQRLDLLAENPDVLRSQQEAGKTSFTFSLEGISRRIRGFLGKSIEELHCLRALHMVLEGPVRQVKVFLILTGHEEEGDWHEFSELLDEVSCLRDTCPGSGKAPFILSATPLISMPHTPMQYHPFPDASAIRRGVHLLRETGKGHGMVVREAASEEEARLAQLLLFADGPQTGAMIHAVRRGKPLPLSATSLLSALESGLDPAWISWACGEKGPSDRLPWDIMDDKDEKTKLFHIYEELNKALQKQGKTLAAPCMPKKRGTTRVQRHHQGPISLTGYRFLLDVAPEMAGMPVRFFQTALARALCLADPHLASAYWRPGAAVKDLEKVPACGSRILSLLFRARVDSLLGETAPALVPQWGWSLNAWAEDEAEASPSGAVLEIQEGAATAQGAWGRIEASLRSRSIRYRLARKRDGEIILIDRSFIQRTGVYYIARDQENKRTRLVVNLAGNYPSFFKTAGLPALWGREGRRVRVAAWLRKGISERCPACRKPLWVDAFSGKPGDLPLCPSACALLH